jgi:hypothetical protein
MRVISLVERSSDVVDVAKGMDVSVGEVRLIIEEAV